MGFNLQMQTDGKIAEGQFQFRPEHVGFRNTIHGGLIATVLDEVMVWACGVVVRQLTYCAEMTVRYRRPVLPGVPVIARAELAENRKGRILIAKATLQDLGGPVVYAEASGKYMPMGSQDTAFMVGDFVDDARSLFTSEAV
jgi:acyl-coenzyme A thioesterase PaaI-like protein